MKRLFTAFLGLATLAAASAGTASMPFQYYDGDLTALGFDNAQTYDVAICIDDPSLAGKTIKSITAYIAPGSESVALNTSLWLSSTLKVKARENVPDIASYPVTVTREQISDETFYGKLYYELEEPYVFTGDPIYVGYTVKIDNTSTEAAKKPVLIGEQTNANGLWLHTTNSMPMWTSYVNQGNGNAAISVEVEGDFPYYSARFGVISEPDVQIDKNFTLRLPVINSGSVPVRKVAFTYSIDGGEEAEGLTGTTIPLQPTLGAGVSLPFNFPAFSTPGSHTITVTINKLNGQPNVNDAPSVTIPVNVLPLVPRHMALVEEFTGLTCPYCPRGWAVMEMLNKEFYKNQVSVVWHTYQQSDPMFPQYGFIGTPVIASGYPCAAINRSGLRATNPYYGTNGYGISETIIEADSRLALAQIDVNGTRDGNTITATVDTEFIRDIEGETYKIGLILCANGLYNSSWGQSNGYVGQSFPEEDVLSLVNGWSSTKYGLVYDFIAVDVTYSEGVEGSIPANIKAGEKYSIEKSFNLSNYSLRNYMENPDDWMIAAFIINPSRTIINAAKYSFVEWPYQTGDDTDPEIGDGDGGGSGDQDWGPDDPEPEPDTDGVGFVVNGEAAAVIYNLQGIRVSNPVPGQIYIVNGKKVIL